MANTLVDSNWDNIIDKITINGIDKNIPIVPHIIPQETNENITTNCEIFNLSPISFGWIIFPNKNWMDINKGIKIKAYEISENEIRANNDGILTAIILPIVGMKFKINAMNPHSPAPSKLNKVQSKKRSVCCSF